MSIYGYKRRFYGSDCKVKNRCEAIFDEDLFKAALDYLDFKFCQRHICIYLSSPGYPVFVHEGHEYKLHRIIGQYIYEDKEGLYVYHHIDKNKLNASRDNLQQLTPSEHQHLHATGRKLSEEHKLAISRFQKGRPSHNRRSIIAMNKQNKIIGEFVSIQEAADTLNILRTAIDNNLNGRSKYCGGFKFQYSV